MSDSNIPAPLGVQPEAAAVDAAASVVPTMPEPPSRPVWTTQVPETPWCPEAWREHLEAVAPGLFESGSASVPARGARGASYGEAIGSRLTSDGWSLVLSSRRGRLHAHRGEHREDAGALLHFADGWVAAVADGAGSAPWSRLGSALATHVVTHALREALQHGRAPALPLLPALREASAATQRAMRQFADAAGIPYKALRTTLLVVAWHGHAIGVLQVGDGAMVLRRTDGTLVHPHAAATGDFSGEVTHFLPDDGALEELVESAAVHGADEVMAVLIASDGVEDPWYPFTRHATTLFEALTRGAPDAAVLPSGLIPAWPGSVTQAADPVHALAEWLAFEKRGENDDRTLCLIQRQA